MSLVGESYDPQRSGWNEAAYKSSIATLNENYGFKLDHDARKLDEFKSRNKSRAEAEHDRGR